MKEDFKFGDKVLVWNDGGRKYQYVFIAKIEGEKPYIVTDNTNDIKSEIDNVGYIHITLFQHCEKVNPMQKYEDVIKEVSMLFYTPINTLVSLINCRNAVWEVDNWEPDWTISRTKHTIFGKENLAIERERSYSRCIFAFKTPEIRNWFFKNFKAQFQILIKHNLL